MLWRHRACRSSWAANRSETPARLLHSLRTMPRRRVLAIRASSGPAVRLKCHGAASPTPRDERCLAAGCRAVHAALWLQGLRAAGQRRPKGARAAPNRASAVPWLVRGRAVAAAWRRRGRGVAGPSAQSAARRRARPIQGPANESARARDGPGEPGAAARGHRSSRRQPSVVRRRPTVAAVLATARSAAPCVSSSAG